MSARSLSNFQQTFENALSQATQFSEFSDLYAYFRGPGRIKAMMTGFSEFQEIWDHEFEDSNGNKYSCEARPESTDAEFDRLCNHLSFWLRLRL